MKDDIFSLHWSGFLSLGILVGIGLGLAQRGAFKSGSVVESILGLLIAVLAYLPMWQTSARAQRKKLQRQ